MFFRNVGSLIAQSVHRLDCGLVGRGKTQLQEEICLSFAASIPALRPHSILSDVYRDHFLRDKRLGLKAKHLPPSGAEEHGTVPLLLHMASWHYALSSPLLYYFVGFLSCFFCSFISSPSHLFMSSFLCKT
jgi:hypothetical protein